MNCEGEKRTMSAKISFEQVEGVKANKQIELTKPKENRTRTWKRRLACKRTHTDWIDQRPSVWDWQESTWRGNNCRRDSTKRVCSWTLCGAVLTTRIWRTRSCCPRVRRSTAWARSRARSCPICRWQLVVHPTCSSSLPSFNLLFKKFSLSFLFLFFQ